MADCEKCLFVSVCKKRPKMPGAKIAECNTFRERLNKEKPMTNADRIRAMSDVELANWLARTQYTNIMEAAEIFGAQLPFDEETLKGSEKECLEWLKQPAEGE